MEPIDRLAVLVRRWPVILAAVLLGLVVAVAAWSLTPSSYRAEARLFVSSGVDVPNHLGRPTLVEPLPAARVRSYPAFVSGPGFLDAVTRQLGPTSTSTPVAGRVLVVVPQGTQLLEVRAVDPTADGAAALANAVGERLGRTIENVEAPAPVRVRTIAPAVPPQAPLWPSLTVLVTSGVTAGLLVGAGAVLLLDRRRAAAR